MKCLSLTLLIALLSLESLSSGVHVGHGVRGVHVTLTYQSKTVADETPQDNP